MKCSVDAVMLYKGKHVFIRRSDESDAYPGQLALCGGFVEDGEWVGEALRREIKEETGLDVYHMKFVEFYDDPDRDPRGRTITFGFWVIADPRTEPKAGDDAKAVVLFNPIDVPVEELAFDHNFIYTDIMRIMTTSNLGMRWT